MTFQTTQQRSHRSKGLLFLEKGGCFQRSIGSCCGYCGRSF